MCNARKDVLVVQMKEEQEVSCAKNMLGSVRLMSKSSWHNVGDVRDAIHGRRASPLSDFM